MSSDVAASPPLTAAASSGRDPGFIALLVGVLGVAIGAVGFVLGLMEGNDRPLLSWLIGVSFWLSIGLGMLILIMITYVFDAGWSAVVRRQLEHGVNCFGWMALLFLPLILVAWFYTPDPGIVWSWLNPDKLVPGGITVSEDVLYIKKQAFLNLPLFTILGYLVSFGGLMWLAARLRYHSFACDRDGDPAHYAACRRLSGGGIPLAGILLSIIAIYWFKSLEYHWFSTMYGVWFFAESMWAGLGAAMILLVWLGSKGALRGLVKEAHFYLVGCIMLAFTVFHAYISFSQYFLIYGANIPEETYWYNIRIAQWGESGFFWLAMILVFGHFLLPFLLLLWYKTKVTLPRILGVSIWFLLMHAVDMFWNILPAKVYADNDYGYVYTDFSITVFDVAMIVGVGGLFLWSFLRSARSQKIIPIRDPYVKESLEYHV